MRLKSLRLENIRSYVDERVDFPLGSVLLSGDVGCGKSTILLAMDFALFGLRKGELEGSDLLRHGANRGSVELAFEVNGTEYSILRTLKRSRDSVGQDTGMLIVDGKKQELMPVELKSAILELFGYPRGNRPIFRYTVYTPQERMKEILFDETNRLATLRKIFSIDKYGQIKSNIKIVAGELRAMRRENEALSRDLEQKMAESAEKAVERERVMVDIDRYSLEISALNELLLQKAEEFETLKKRMNDMNSLRREISRIESEMRVKSGRLPRIRSEISDLSAKMSRISLAPLGNSSSLKEAISALEAKRDILVKEFAVVSADLTRFETLMKKGVCSFCGQTVRGDFQKHLDEKNRIVGELKKNTEVSDAELSSLREKLRLFEKAAGEKRLFDEYSDRKERLEKELAATGAEINELESELRMLAGQEDNTLEEVFRKIDGEISAVNRSKSELEKASARAEQKLYEIDSFLRNAEREISEKKKAREKVGKINDAANWLESCFAPLMDIIEKHVLSTIQRVFNDFFQKWFAVIMGEQLSVRIDETFSPVIEQNGYTTEYSNLSGGEKTAVALAYRLALTKAINSLIETINTRDLLILDEPTDGFSSEQLDRLRDVLAELRLSQILIVSHESKIDSFVDSVIKVYKEDHVSRIVS